MNEAQLKICIEIMQTHDDRHRRFISKDNFPAFCLYYFTSYFKRPNSAFHYDIMRSLQDLQNNIIDELLIVGFRGCSKTVYMQLWLIWLIVFKKRKYLNVDSYDGENAERTLFEISQILMTNKKVIADYGVLYKRDSSKFSNSQNRVDNFTTVNGIRVEANTTNVDVRGRKHFEDRPEVRVLDDFENLITKGSPAKTQSIRQNIMSGMGGLNPNGVMLYLANYLSEYGNVQFLMDRAKDNPKIRVLNIPIVKDGKPTWPQRYVMTDAEALITGKESIESIQRKFGSFVFSYEFMNLPVDEAMSEFKKEYIQHITELDLAQLRTRTYITIDSAVKESESADFTGITINRVSDQNKWYITTYREKMNSKKLIDHIFELWDTYKPEWIGLEETTFTIAIKPFIDDEMRLRRKYLNFRMLKHQKQNKITRIRGLIPRWESRSIFLVGDNIGLKDEMRAFPNGANDDILDSLAYQVSEAETPVNNYGRPTINKPMQNRAR